jgi:deoxyribodipyrimidine photo-lyase
MAQQILWFRQDLRLHDNPALCAAAAAGSVLPLYILDDESPAGKAMGGAQRWWLHQSLQALAKDLAAHGLPLILRRGRADSILRELVAETGAVAIHAHRHFEPWWQEVEEAVGEEVELHLHKGNHLINPRTVRTGAGTRYRVFTPFWKQLQMMMPPPAPLAVPAHIAPPEHIPASDTLEDWGLRPTWRHGFDIWSPGEKGAQAAFHAFLPYVADYEEERNFPVRLRRGWSGTSRLSPHIHFGEISPPSMWHAVRKAVGGKGKSFLSEIAWREHGLNLVDQYPDYAEKNGRALFDNFPWRSGVDADREFTAWTQGRTGYPLVDAGMRQLWHTGWMHNRLRMVTASFLVKHLLIDWRRGERWFWDTLLDADMGANVMNWQYVAGSGVDAPVFSRMMAPFLQSPKFEMAEYIRHYVPELAHLRDDEIHAPHETRATPPNYPLPLIGHEAARARAMAAWEEVRAE